MFPWQQKDLVNLHQPFQRLAFKGGCSLMTFPSKFWKHVMKTTAFKILGNTSNSKCKIWCPGTKKGPQKLCWTSSHSTRCKDVRPPRLLHYFFIPHDWYTDDKSSRNSSATVLPVFKKGANPTTSIDRGWSVYLQKNAHGFVRCHVWNSWYQILVDVIAGSYEDLTSTARHI